MADRPRRILVHAGLPEGGGGPVQRFLWSNREALEAHLDLLRPFHLKEPAQAARHYARHLQPLALADLAEALEATVPPRLHAGRDAVLSCDALSGELPGAPGVADWRAVPALAAVVAGYLGERFPDAEVRMVYTTRADWVRQAWLHRLTTHRMQLDRAAFARAVAGADPDAAVAEAAEAVAAVAGPGPPAETFVLTLEEAARHPQGAGGALLEALDLPEALRTALQPVSRDRAPDDAVAAELLALNRSGMADKPLREAKGRLLDEVGLAAWARLPSPAA